MTGSGDITVVTSIPPVSTRVDRGEEIGEQYQRMCVRSWVAAGFDIISVNHASEAATVSAQHPEVRVHSVEQNAMALGGKPVPWLDDLFAVAEQARTRYCGIINADIMLEAGAWVDIVTSKARGSVLVGKRHDIKDLYDSQPSLDPDGYDLFFFEKQVIPYFRHNDYAMGLPWWDYWLPIAARLKHLPLSHLDTVRALHLEHAERWDWDLYGVMAEKFVRDVNNTAPGLIDHLSRLLRGKMVRKPPSDIEDVIERCRKLKDPSYPKPEDSRIRTRQDRFHALAASLRVAIAGNHNWPV